MRRLTLISVLTGIAIALGTPAAWACGGLISPTGAVQLQRTTTLVSYADGVEHYVTSFAFGGADSSFGSIVPLPDVPTVVERGGDWTLQRAQIEVGQGPVALAAAPAEEELAEDRGVEVLLETRVDSLDITVLRGGGDEVVTWAAEQGFVLSSDAPEMLRFYADRSPVFMAARFDAATAAADGFVQGDGIPIHLEIPTDDPWVPLRILALGKPDAEIVQADVFLLTPERPQVLAGEGVAVRRSEPARTAFLDDLRSDERSTWVPEAAWFSHVVVDGPAGALRTDLAIDAFGGEPDPVDAGLRPLSPAVVAPLQSAPTLPDATDVGTSAAVVALGALAGAALLAAVFGLAARRA